MKLFLCLIVAAAFDAVYATDFHVALNTQFKDMPFVYAMAFIMSVVEAARRLVP